MPILETSMSVPGFSRLITLFLIFLAAFVPLSALDLPIRRIPDDSSLRASLVDSWFKGRPGTVLNQVLPLQTLPGGGRVEVRTEAAGEEFMIILARELNGAFPGYAQGSWVLTRRMEDGQALRIRIFPRSDFNAYVQFRPFSAADKCVMDVVIYNAYVVNALPLPIPFERLLTLPLEEVLAVAKDKFPLRYFEPQPDSYRDVRRFIGEVRKRLPMQFQDDGALDENGEYVFIDDLAPQHIAPGLNCSGFAKWVVDGILRPVTGRRLSIPPLKAPFGDRGSGFTAPWENLKDPFFGLDWTRNLASIAGRVLRTPTFGELAEIEVRDAPFSAVIRRDRQGSVAGDRIGPTSFPGYLTDAGFGIEGIHPLLYTLAIDEPGRIYLASVNTEMGDPATDDNPRGRPRMRKHFHVAVLVPYFTEGGFFRIALFESAEETLFDTFKTRYSRDHYVNLVRIPIEITFDP
ncbi:hypothetical protein AGMMS49942_00420 [Spirochaetia bacterium]|nr:hypothetical protein AGMMS49942_00420 [Spirochaetia bacterium]